MPSKAVIYLNFSRAIQQAKELDEQAQKLRHIAESDVGDTMANIDKNWQGDNAKLFLNKCGTLQDNLIKAAKLLENNADGIRLAAKRVLDADLRAKRIAETSGRDG